MRKAKPGADVKSLGDIAEKIIAEHGFKDHSFRKVGLALGHHVGLNVHDGRMNEGKLKKGNSTARIWSSATLASRSACWNSLTTWPA